MPEEKQIISEVEQQHKVRCPHLRRIEKFYLCGHGLSQEEEQRARETKPSPDNRIYTRHLDTAELQLWCMSDKHKNCGIYQGWLKPEKE